MDQSKYAVWRFPPKERTVEVPEPPTADNTSSRVVIPCCDDELDDEEEFDI
jgi:hypothetical protein